MLNKLPGSLQKRLLHFESTAKAIKEDPIWILRKLPSR